MRRSIGEGDVTAAAAAIEAPLGGTGVMADGGPRLNASRKRGR